MTVTLLPTEYIAWFLAFIELTLALYILALNPRQLANQLVALFLGIVGLNSFFEGQFVQATRLTQAYVPSVALAVTTPMIQPLLILITILLIKKSWISNRWRWIWWGTAVFTALPLVVTILDVRFGTRLYYTGLDAQTYSGGFIALRDYTQGVFAPFIRIMGIQAAFLFLLGLLIYLARFDRSLPRQPQRLAVLLFVTNGIGGVILLALQLYSLREMMMTIQAGTLIVSFFLGLVYGYAGFQQIISERKLQRGSLQNRLTLLVLVVTAPLLFGIAFFIVSQSNQVIEAQAGNLLRAAGDSGSGALRAWLNSRVSALQQAAAQTDMAGLQAERQALVLQNLATVYPSVLWIGTYDLDGTLVSQKGAWSLAGATAEDVRRQIWFAQSAQGVPYSFQAIPEAGAATGVLTVAVPILDSEAQVVGVLALAEKLSAFGQELDLMQVGNSGFSYVVDEQDRLVGFSSAVSGEAFAPILADMSDYPPVQAARQGQQGDVFFLDGGGVSWRAYAQRLENGWAVIAQQPEAELRASLQVVQRSAGWAGVAGLGILLGLLWLTIRQSLSPVQTLTKVARAITAGDLSQTVEVETSDELGILSETFNQMTAQLRESIAGLEQRVAERTFDLERRSRQLEAAAKVAKEAASIRDIRQLLTRTTHLISRNFGFYHVGIFLVDDARQYAVLQAANSEGGQRMLAREHKLRIGQVGIVGYVASTGLPRIALDVGEDAVFFNNPDLPETRSEMALPLKIRDQVIGVLDVQSTQAAAFTNEDVETLQLMTDQIALALENTRLLQESRSALEELNALYGQQTRQAWRQRLERKAIAYRYNRLGIQPVEALPVDQEARSARTAQESQGAEAYELTIPLVLRGQELGTLTLRREHDQKPWSKEERNLAADLVGAVLPALEIARLVEEIQNRAQVESLVGQVSNRVQSSLDLETVVKTAVQEIGTAVKASRVQIRLSDGGSSGKGRLEEDRFIQRS